MRTRTELRTEGGVKEGMNYRNALQFKGIFSNNMVSLTLFIFKYLRNDLNIFDSSTAYIMVKDLNNQIGILCRKSPKKLKIDHLFLLHL